MLHPVYINWPKKQDNHGQPALQFLILYKEVLIDFTRSIFWATTLQILTASK